MAQSTPIAGAAGDRNMGDAAQRAADQARRAAGAARDSISSGAEELADSARDYAARGRDALFEKVNEQKGAGADYVSGVADTLRRVAGEFDRQMPFAATYIRSAADQVDNVADGVRSGDVSQLVRQAQRFAREQPTLVAGMAMLAGFGVMRLVRNASAAGEPGADGTRAAPGAAQPRADASQWGRS